MSVAQNLIKVEASDDDPSTSVFEADGLISNSNYIAKKTTMVLFVNGEYMLPNISSYMFFLSYKSKC